MIHRPLFSNSSPSLTASRSGLVAAGLLLLVFCLPAQAAAGPTRPPAAEAAASGFAALEFGGHPILGENPEIAGHGGGPGKRHAGRHREHSPRPKAPAVTVIINGIVISIPLGGR